MNEKYKIDLSIKAKNDLRDIVLYIKNELKEPNIAVKYSRMIKDEIKTLEYFPQKFAVLKNDNIKDLNIRKLNIKNYIVFYRINKNKKIVNIDRILYGPSDWANKI